MVNVNYPILKITITPTKPNNLSHTAAGAQQQGENRKPMLILLAVGNEINEIYGLNTNFYLGNYIYSNKLLIELLEYIRDNDEDAVIIVQSDHGIHLLEDEEIMAQLSITKEEVQDIRNSVISAFYIPQEYRNGDEDYLDNPLNISRYLVNNYVGENYEYMN